MMFYDCRECESRTGIVLCYVTGTMTTDWYCSVLCDGNDGYTGIALCYVTGTMTTDWYCSVLCDRNDDYVYHRGETKGQRWVFSRVVLSLVLPSVFSSFLSASAVFLSFFCLFLLLLFLSSPFLLLLFSVLVWLLLFLLLSWCCSALFLVLFLRAFFFLHRFSQFSRVSCFVVL